MNQDAVQQFFRKVSAVPSLGAEVRASSALDESAREARLVELASGAGFSVSASDGPRLRELAAGLQVEGELSDDELDMSGGDGTGASYPGDPGGGLP